MHTSNYKYKVTTLKTHNIIMGNYY